MVLPLQLLFYHLYIAKIEKKIQNEEPDEFKDVFIMFGAFHIEWTIFSAIGKLIEGSVGSYLLIESGVIVPGPMSRFLKSKMYNRCRRGHIILSTALHGLHFQSFLMDTHWRVKSLVKNKIGSVATITNGIIKPKVCRSHLCRKERQNSTILEDLLQNFIISY